MRLAIHHDAGSYSDRWIEACRERGIDHRIVDCYRTDIMERLRECDGLLWHFHHEDFRSRFAALPVLVSAQTAGLVVFPDYRTAWHFDDKISQKYLLEAHGAPLVPTWIFYDEREALAWIETETFPKVFKLTCGAGSKNVRLVQTKDDARELVRQAFGRGFVATTGYGGDLRRRMRTITSLQVLWQKLAQAPTAIRKTREVQRMLPRQRGYVYFQTFMPDNDHDTRITVIGDRAFGFTRGVRPHDFRASGSGRLDLDPERVDRRCVEIAFDVARRLGTQSLAFDFVKDRAGAPHIVEVSYAYLGTVVHDCPGHWDSRLNWHAGHVWPQDAILDDLLSALSARGAGHPPVPCQPRES